MKCRILLSVVAPFIMLMVGCNEKNNTGNKEQSGDKMAKSEVNVVSAKLTKVKFETSMGDIIVELNEQKAPVSVKNFLRYVEEGFYDGTIFHRVMHSFMIQAGGYTADMKRKETHESIINESKNGLKNARGTIAMARTMAPNSATSQFFINHVTNDGLNYKDSSEPGYAVFGKVITGMDVVDAIALVRTTTKEDMQNVPIEPVIIKSAKVVKE